MSEVCKWLHCQLEILPLVKFPFNLAQLPLNGIYFFYETDETWGHNGKKPRIVRVGTHRQGNFRNRIKEHFLLNRYFFEVNVHKPKYSDRSIFRKNIGRALLNRENDEYLKIWNIDFTKNDNRECSSRYRDAEKEKAIETEISIILRNNFRFRFIVMEVETERKGSNGLEGPLIGTLSQCKLCRPSLKWLGNFSPISEIRDSGLWLRQHLGANEITEKEKSTISKAIHKTIDWLQKKAS